jgi:hypothetical protein
MPALAWAGMLLPLGTTLVFSPRRGLRTTNTHAGGGTKRIHRRDAEKKK